LAALLAHADRRVRQGAQFALVSRGAAAIPSLLEASRSRGESASAADSRRHRLGRIHAIWALGQLGRVPSLAAVTLGPVVALLQDHDEEIRAQAARTLGEARYRAGADALIARLSDPSPRVRSLVALALHTTGKPAAFEPLLAVLRANADTDPFLRHAAVMGLVGSMDETALPLVLSDSSPSVRLGLLLALRRQGDPRVASFLRDSDSRVATEAARAIYDAEIDGALPALAGLASQASSPRSEPAWRRVVNAAGRLGRAEDARALAALAVRKDVPEGIRAECVEILAAWPQPPGRDRVTGLWRPIAPHRAVDAAAAIAPVYDQLLAAAPGVRNAAIRAAGPLPIPGAAAQLTRVFHDPQRFAATRVEALKAVERLHDAGLETGALADLASKALGDSQASVRVEGRRLLAKLDPARAVTALASVLDGGTISERQGAFATLAGMPEGAVDRLLENWLDRLAKNQVASEVALDLLDAAKVRKDPAVVTKLAAHESARPKGDPLAPYRETLAGGDPDRGESILRTKAEAQCLRCHKLNGRGGEVGPELAGVAGRGDRRYILESIVTPNQQIAKGFETLLVATTDGQVHTGILKKETDKSLELVSPDGKPIILAKDTVEERKRGASAMPEDLVKQLSRAEIRDLIAFLSTLK
ncbi:MAG: HEAT repeat domain-containing protein, partial [Isosphaeraceae bacterium]